MAIVLIMDLTRTREIEIDCVHFMRKFMMISNTSAYIKRAICGGGGGGHSMTLEINIRSWANGRCGNNFLKV